MLDFNHHLEQKSIGHNPKRKPKLSALEVMTIMILFQLIGIRFFKWFYNQYIIKHHSQDFPRLVTYNRFVELQKKTILPMAVFAKTCCPGACTGISFVDPTNISICMNKRIYNYKVFKHIATLGKSTMGYF